MAGKEGRVEGRKYERQGKVGRKRGDGRKERESKEKAAKEKETGKKEAAMNM